MLKALTKYGLVAVWSFAFLCYAQIPDVSPFDGYTAGQSQQGGPAGSYALSAIETVNPAEGLF